MQTVNFHCPHCGNLMAVGTNLLGRNVRCPHCKQVVRAPAAAGEAPAGQLPAPQAPPLTPAPPPQLKVPSQTEHHESIFGERHDEDLFGSEPLKPRLPQETRPSPPAPEPPAPPPAPAPAPQYVETQTYVPPPASAPEFPPFSAAEPAANDRPQADELPERGYQVRGPRSESPATPAFAWILLAYSAVVTVLAGVFAYQYFTAGSKGDHPFKAIPDFYGKYEKATGAENRKQLAYQGLPDPKLDVPPDLLVKLGDEITVGDIRVRPTEVTRQVMDYVREDAVRGPVKNQASAGLALTLQVKNVSAGTTLYPNDPAFNRAFDKDQPFPYTALQIDRQFYYGPFAWPMPPDTKDNYLVAYEIPKSPLGPGQEQATYVTVAPVGLRAAGKRNAIDDVNELRKKNENPTLLWRVQLRRGFVAAKADDGRDVDVSATAVIGVEFKVNDIHER